MNDNTEEYCRECQHPHVNERLRKEVAELRKENEDLASKLKFADRNCGLLRGHRDEQEETIKRLTEALEGSKKLLEEINNGNRRYVEEDMWEDITEELSKIDSALSGTKETE